MRARAKHLPVPSRRAPSLWLLFALLTGCELTERDLAAFQSTATGPSKIRAVLEDGSRDPALRARAAMLLLDLERHDVRGPELLQKELESLETDSRTKLATPLARTLLARMQTDLGKKPSERALRSKHAAEDALDLLSAKERAALGDQLLRFMVRDIDNRANDGARSLEALAARLGTEATAALLDGLRSDLPITNIVRLARLLDQHASKDARAACAAKLLDIAQHLGVPQPMLPALGLFADQKSVRERLIATAQDGSRATSARAEALTLLARRTTASELLPLLGLALDDDEPLSLRELAVTRAGETGSSEALPGLLLLTSDRSHARLRSLSGEQVLELGGEKMLSAFFRALPHSWDVPYSRDEIDAYSKHIDKLAPNTALLMLMGEKLHSSLWWPRVIALRYFAAQGAFEDLWRIRKHIADTAPIVGDGWPRGYTVGQEAERCVNALNERLLRSR